jgi:alpha-ketoglutarate-dependent taurine dioxygenase
MAISVTALHQSFVGEVSGVDLCSPVKVDFLEISEALDRYAVLVFRDQQLTDEQQIAFSRLFGSLETSIGTIRKDRKHRLPSSVLADISNLDENNNIRSTSDRWRMMMLANQLWHTDSSFKRVPGKISLLSAHEVPPYGGETEFADLRAAYDALGQETKERIEDLVAEHSIFHFAKPHWLYRVFRRGARRASARSAGHRSHASGLRTKDTLSSLTCVPHHRMAGRAWSRSARRVDCIRDPTTLCLSAPLAGRRSGRMG